jgi:hypothetical protein
MAHAQLGPGVQVPYGETVHGRTDGVQVPGGQQVEQQAAGHRDRQARLGPCLLQGHALGDEQVEPGSARRLSRSGRCWTTDRAHYLDQQPLLGAEGEDQRYAARRLPLRGYRADFDLTRTPEGIEVRWHATFDVPPVLGWIYVAAAPLHRTTPGRVHLATPRSRDHRAVRRSP